MAFLMLPLFSAKLVPCWAEMSMVTTEFADQVELIANSLIFHAELVGSANFDHVLFSW